MAMEELTSKLEEDLEDLGGGCGRKTQSRAHSCLPSR